MSMPTGHKNSREWDRTDVKRIEEARDDALAYAESIVETVREPLVILDKHLRVRGANRSFYRTFRVSPQETEERLLYELGNRQWDIPRLRTLLEDVLPANIPFDDFEVEHDFPDIGRKVMLLNARQLRQAGAELILLAIEDITARKRVEAGLQQSEARLQLFFEYAPAALAVFDHDMCYLAASRRWRQDYGLGTQDLIGRSHYEIFPEIPEVWRTVHRRGLAGEVVRCEEDRFERLDGSVQWERWEVRPWHVGDGAIGGIVIFTEDITARKEAAEALRAADRRKDEFLAILAHELRNPLAPIRHAVDILKLRDLSDPTLQAALDVFDRQSHRLARLVDDLLDVNRITHGKLQLRRERVELAAVIDQALEGTGPELAAAGQEFSVSLPPKPIYLEADPLRLSQVFVNLLTNAAKYTEARGRIRLSAQQAGMEVAVTVADTGIGIAPEHLSEIFEMFTQVSSPVLQPQRGIGIGLALARRLVEMHGGRIEAHSEGVGCGSAFIVHLPVVADTATRLPPDRGETNDRKAPPSRRILVVDDEAICARALAGLLQRLGNEVEIAHDGLEAVAAAERYRPEVILLDIGMPKLDGYAACRQIRAQPWGKATQIVAVTGWGTDEHRRRSAEAGFDAHLVKPVDAPALAQLLAEAPTAKG